jgi:hypothetical protein
MDADCMRLKRVWTSWEQGYEVGENGITDIVMLTDGNGPMGNYDVIYLYKRKIDAKNRPRPFAALPAHMAHLWEYE